MLRAAVAACLAAAVVPGGLAPVRPAGAERPGEWQSWSYDGTAQLDRELADPAALPAGEVVHVYGTSARHCTVAGCGTLRVPRFQGSSLRAPGTLAGDAMPERPAWVSALDPDIWAPSVTRIGDRYTMYFAATAATGPEAGTKCIGLAHAAQPDEPFVPEAQPLRCTPGFWNIDPFVVVHEGRRFLLWREDDAVHVTGKVVAAELHPDGRALAGPPRTLLTGAHSWEDGYPAGTRDGSSPGSPDPATVGGRRLPDSAAGPATVDGIGPIENPALARHPTTGEWLLTWSANRWETQAYATGLARCDEPLGPCHRIGDTSPWLRRSDDPAITTAARFGGAGGMALVATARELYAVFHAYRGDGQHPAQPRIAWAYRVDPDGATRYRLVES